MQGSYFKYHRVNISITSGSVDSCKYKNGTYTIKVGSGSIKIKGMKSNSRVYISTPYDRNNYKSGIAGNMYMGGKKFNYFSSYVYNDAEEEYKLFDPLNGTEDNDCITIYPIYYGDEAGVYGFSDPLNRKTYPWGNEDKEIFSILYATRFSKYKDTVRANMKEICNDYGLTSPKLKSLSETSHLINKWILKMNTNEK